MSRLRTELNPEKDVPVRQRMALFQSNTQDTGGGRRGQAGPTEQGTRGAVDTGCGRRGRGRPTEQGARAAVDTGRGVRGEGSSTSSLPPPKVTARPPASPAPQDQTQGLPPASLRPASLPPAPPSDPHVQQYAYASHCESLFSALRGFQGEGLLTDCDLHLHGNLLRFHWVVLAAVSDRVEAWLRAGKAGLAEAQQQLSGGHVTVTGLRAVLELAYGGEMQLGSSAEGGALEDVMSACRCRLSGVTL